MDGWGDGRRELHEEALGYPATGAMPLRRSKIRLLDLFFTVSEGQPLYELRKRCLEAD